MIPNAFFQSFVVRNAANSIDIKKSVKKFEEEFVAWMQEQSDIGPAVVKELTRYGRLGGKSLITFVTHGLNLPPSKENTDRIKNAMNDLQNKGIIKYQTTENGSTKGKGAGWVMVPTKDTTKTTAAA